MSSHRNVCAALFLLLAGCAGRTDSVLDDQRRSELNTYWDLYQLDDSDWPKIRQRWYAYGGPERDVLVMSLVRDLIRLAPTHAQVNGSLEPAWRRPQRELLALGKEATVPVLLEALRTGRDTASLGSLSDTLAGFGAVEELTDLLDHPREGDSAVCRPFVMSALVKAGGRRAIERVGEVLTNDAEWRQRASAADALAAARYSDRKLAVATLALAYLDSDTFVARRAVQATLQLGEVTAAPRLAQLYEQAVGSGDTKTASLALDALRKLTKQTVRGDDPALWKQAAERAASNPR